jgi:hypothetical protein
MSTPAFTEAVKTARDAAQAEVNRYLAVLAGEVDADTVANFVEHDAGNYMRAAMVFSLYNEALERELEKEGRGPAWLSVKVGRLLDRGSRWSDPFQNAAADAKRAAATVVLRTLRPYLDPAKVLEYVG